MKAYNILWLFSDEHRGQAMHCAGDTNVKTTHLDALAAQGTRFSHCYSVSPLCAPFRASVYTGQYIHEHGVGCLHRPIMSGVPVVPQVLQQGGYHTIHIGKWHLSGGAAPSHFVAPCFRPGWDEWFGWENSNQPFATTYSTGTAPHMKQLEGYQTDACTDLANDFLDRASESDKPWFMVLSVEPPHDPHVAPPEYMAQYANKEIDFRPNVPESWKTEENIAKARGYYAQIKNLDDNIGRLLTKLKETGQDENTIIFYFSDHGDYMGSQGRSAKFFAQEESSNIPLIIRHPDAAQKGIVNDGLITSLDIPTTTLAMARLSPAPQMHGQDFSPLLCDAAARLQEDVLIELDSFFDDHDPFYRYRALRNEKYLYVNAPLSERCMLYNMETDPYQMDNLYGNPAHKTTQDALHKRLAARLAELDDDYFAQ
ncbi:MAG: sulfatase-like hydrolase/transferase [Faecalibacterium sp.]